MSVREKIRAEIDDLRDKIHDLEVRAKAVSGEKKEDYKELIDGLKKRRDALKERFDAAASKGEEVWSDLTKELDMGLTALRKEYDGVKARFRL